MGINIIIFVSALTALIVFGRLIVRMIMTIACQLGVSEYAVAFVLLAVATSIPELFIGIASARQHAGELVLATALGSNIINMTLIVGAATVISLGISTSGLNLRRDVLFGGAITVLPIFLLADSVIDRKEGLLLLGLFSLYLALMYRDQHKHHTVADNRHNNIGDVLVNIVILAALVSGLVYASNLTVDSAVSLATAIGIPSFLIGIFVLALSTSLPELTTTLHSALARRPGLALGTILGSNAADSALIIGTAALTQPLRVTINHHLVVTGIFVTIAVILLALFAITKKRISVREGLFLLSTFLSFGLILFLFDGFS